jgi:hypothetical protein
MDDDEEATVRTLTYYLTEISDLIEQFRGRIVDTPGRSAGTTHQKESDILTRPTKKYLKFLQS